MQLNELPVDYDGLQKRQTEFESEEAKLAYDADNLIRLARESLEINGTLQKEQKLNKAQKTMLVMAIIVIVNAHRKDFNDDLRGAIYSALNNNDTPDEDMARSPKKVLTADQKASLFQKFEGRFASTDRSKDIPWAAIKSSLETAGEQAIYGLFQMEENGHEVGVTKVEKDGRNGFRFDSCSKESPATIRDIDYFDAERIAESDWGVPLMSPEVFEELRAAGIITNRGTWDHLKTENPGTPQKPGLAWSGYDFGFYRDYAAGRGHDGGFRCSLWVPEV